MGSADASTFYIKKSLALSDFLSLKKRKEGKCEAVCGIECSSHGSEKKKWGGEEGRKGGQKDSIHSVTHSFLLLSCKTPFCLPAIERSRKSQQKPSFFSGVDGCVLEREGREVGIALFFAFQSRKERESCGAGKKEKKS